jgi:23S rRNA (guanosine2251-2'-O)-methyltransferase
MRKLSLKELGRPTVEEFRRQPKTRVVVVLDNVRSALNVGSVFRTADAFAFEKIYLCGITARPPHREIEKTAIGATDSVAWEYAESAVDAVRRLRSEGYRTLAVEQAEGSVKLQDFRWEKDRSYALVFGNEVRGVSDEVMAEVDGCLEVPQFGSKHSLNIAVCVGVVAWEALKGLRW